MASSKRSAILMGVLLLALGAYFVQQHFGTLAQERNAALPEPAPLPGKNSISNFKVHQDVMGTWVAELDYFYTGEPPHPVAYIEPGQKDSPVPDHFRGPTSTVATFIPTLQRGSHHVSLPLEHPQLSESTTRTITVAFFAPATRRIFVSQQVDQAIDWPTWQMYEGYKTLSNNTPEKNLRLVQDFIATNTGPTLDAARSILEKLIHQNPRFDAAYVELARVAERSDNLGPEGLHQAETLVKSALDIRPENTDAKILLGHIYTLQHHYPEAETLYGEAAAADASSPWLWADWGEMLALQHKSDEAIARYRQAIAIPMTHNPSDRGRKFAYQNLLELLGQKQDLDGMEVVFKQQVTDYGPGSCYSAEYSRFMLQIRGDVQGAIDLSKRALNKDCNDAPSREVLGLAEYVKWADTPGPERVGFLNEARLYLPTGPNSLYLLAASDRTAPAAKQLISSGESIDQKDNEGRTALSYALEKRDLSAARRLLVLHARPDIPIGPEEVPLALMPVIEENLAAIRLLREFGVNYSKLSFRGHTAIEFAKQSQNHELLKALGGGGTSL
jgi:tetratricopeptide (TPR) repeat protein